MKLNFFRNNQHKLAGGNGSRRSPCTRLCADRARSPHVQHHRDRHLLPHTLHALANLFSTGEISTVGILSLTHAYIQTLGDTTAKYRWFALVYLFGMFFVFPGFIFLLSLAGPTVIYVVFVPIAALLLLITIVNQLQRRKPKFLPAQLQNWEFLPEPIRSFEPVDRLIVSCLARYTFFLFLR